MSDHDDNKIKRLDGMSARIAEIQKKAGGEDLIFPDYDKVNSAIDRVGDNIDGFHRLVQGGKRQNFSDILRVSHPVIGRLIRGERGVALSTFLEALSMMEQSTRSLDKDEMEVDILEGLVEMTSKAVDVAFDIRLMEHDGETILPEPSRRGKASVRDARMRQEARRDEELTV